MSAIMQTHCRPPPHISVYSPRDDSLVAQPSNVPTPTPRPPLPLEILAMLENILSHSTNEAILSETIQSSPQLSDYLKDRNNVHILAEAMTNSSSPMRSLRILVLAHALGCSLKQSVYQGIAFQLAKRRLWNGVLRVVSLGKEHTGKTTSRLLSWRARALIETRDFAALQAVLQEYKEQNMVPSRRVFHLVLSGHIQNRDVPMAKLCLLLMSEAGVPPDASTHAIVATYYRALGMDPHVEARALEALHSLETQTATNVVNSLIRLRLDCQDLNGAAQLLGLFKQRDVSAASIIISNADGVGSCPAGSHRLPVEFPPFVRRDLTPNAATFSIFINHFTTQSNLPEALQLFQTMVMAGITPNGIATASLIHLFFSMGQEDTAVRLVADMCPVKAPFYTSMLMLSSLERHGQDRQDLPWVPSGMVLTIQILNALFRGLLRTRGMKVTGPFLRVLQANNIQPNAVTLEILLDHLSKRERSKPRVLLTALRRFTSQDTGPTLRHMHIILACILRHEKFLSYGRGWDMIAAKFSSDRREETRFYPEHRFIKGDRYLDPTAGMQLSPALSHRRLARPVLQSFADRNMLTDPVMLALRIRHAAVLKSDPDTAKCVFNALLSRGIRPNEYHIGGLMEGLTQSDDLDGAIDVMKSAEKAGIRPNVVLFTILISACARRGNPERALQVFQQMISADVEPDVASIDAVASAFFAVGNYSMCKRVLISLWPYIQPFPDNLHHAPLERMIRHFRLLARNYRVIQGPSKEDRTALHIELGRLREHFL